MRVRIFEGAAWTTARPLGDFTFDRLPFAGHKVVIAAEAGWATAVVSDVVHRISDAGQAADVALLVARMTTSDDQSDLPFAELDRLAGIVAAPAAPSRPGPWR